MRGHHTSSGSIAAPPMVLWVCARTAPRTHAAHMHQHPTPPVLDQCPCLTPRTTPHTRGVSVFHYKELSAHTVWLPSIDPDATPLVTNPEGIELFDSAPIDPVDATSMPAEVELRTEALQAAKKQKVSE